jgi:hypothetical protein
MLGNEIKIIPSIEINSELKEYLIIGFDNFVENEENPEYRDNIITFDILCKMETWDLGDFKLRPYKIAGEIDSMFNKKHLTGIGQLNFRSGGIIPADNGFGGISLIYKAIHGKEDKK